jgi:hypothetical protein
MREGAWLVLKAGRFRLVALKGGFRATYGPA